MDKMNQILYANHLIETNDYSYIKKSLQKKFITSGSFVDVFEKKISKYLNCQYAVSCSNGTAAIHLSLIAANIKKGDVIIMPIINFIASLSISKLFQAKIFFADVDSNTGQMTPEDLLYCINKNKIKKIKAVFTMYLGGSSENSVEFWKLKNKYKFILIEDACHAFGSSYIFNKKKYKIGSCAHSDMSIFSFHPAKTITTGEVWALTTNNFKFFKKAKIARSHGILRNNKKIHWSYSINNFGMNYRLSDINCALGVSQIKKVKRIIKKRHAISKKYNIYLKKFSEFVSIPEYKFSNLSSNHLKILIFNLKKLNCKKKDIFIFFKKRNIFLQYHYIPLYKFKIFKLQNNINYPKAEQFYKKAISFPIYYSLKEREIKYIFNCFSNFIEKYKIK